ncbi:hypothetical protein NG895_08535 [Aeoliella sp. ICT_H6.2]|uniref:Uncharacterized protein n=1 Tax=Aeoliella straminimaris TaxID=2954799 RepID=A0A9X2F7T0_9BACT|nr:hypothetical protein [Aeoliella straminimaris]MCO6043952.1 hypothetical protein [Aeoliella straminimaris]
MSNSDPHGAIQDYVEFVSKASGQAWVQKDGIDWSQMDQSEALVFFLSGLSFKTTSNPGEVATLASRFSSGDFSSAPSWFFFEPHRLIDRDCDGFWEYCPPDTDVPYVYFDSDNYHTAFSPNPGDTSDIAVPYRMDDGGFVAPAGFQIISPGPDSKFGKSLERYWPSERGFTQADFDNATSFTGTSFEKLHLAEALSLGAGKWIRLFSYASAFLLPIAVLAWQMKRPSKIKLSVFAALYTILVLLIGTIAVDSRQVGLSQVWTWFIRDVAGIAFAIGWLASAMLLPSMSRRPSMMYYTKWSSIAAIAFCVIWYAHPNWLETRTVFAGWPFAYSSNHHPFHTALLLADFAVGIVISASFLWLRWLLSCKLEYLQKPLES